jgi:PAS domain S-box-containing protein
MDSSGTPLRLKQDLECPETAIVTTSLDGKILAWSPGAEKVWGYSSQEVLGKHVSMLGYPRARSVEPVLDEAVRGRHAVKTHLATGLDKRGRPREVAVSAEPVFNAEGDLGAVTATVHDLARKRRKDAVAQKLVDLFIHTQVGVCVGNPQTRTLEMVNPAFARMHGFSPEELTGRPITDVFPVDLHGEVEACMRTAGEAGQHSMETEHVRRDGSRFPVLIDVTCVRGPGGEILHFVADVHDISRVVWAERRARQTEELRRREGELIEVIRQMRAGVLIADAASKKILMANDEAVRLFGPAVRAGGTLDDARARLAVSKTDGTRLARGSDWPLERSLSGEVVNQEELSLDTEEGRRVLLVSSAPVRDARGRVERAVATFHDITERKVQEEAIRAFSGRLEHRVRERTADLSQKVAELESFAYTVAHDLRAPLRAMFGFVDLLLLECKTDEAAADYAHKIQDAAGRMDDLITDLLAYVRLTYQDVHVGPVPLGRVVERVVEPWRSRLVQGELELDAGALAREVLADEGMLAQALSQLIDNAAKFVAPGDSPRIRVTAEEGAGRVRLVVEDHGIGLDPEDADRIFGIFERLHRAEEFPGTGIGLAIVRKAAERLGGRAGVESRPGQGSRFWIEVGAAGPPAE